MTRVSNSYHSLSKLSLLLAFSSILLLLNRPLFASTQYSMGLNGGTLSWTVTGSTGHCYGSQTYQQYNMSNFTFSYTYASPQGTNINLVIPLGGGFSWFDSPGSPYCPPSGGVPSGGAYLIDSTQFYRIYFTPTSWYGGTATMEDFDTGAVYPKYLVISIAYAPPGAGNSNGNQSYVDHTNTTELGTDTSFSASFQQSNTLTYANSLLGIKNTISSSYTQEEDTSQSISVNQTSSTSNSYPGDYPANAVGLDHDNDIILVWLNPALDCIAESAWSLSPNNFPAAVQCIEYDPKGAPGDPDSQYGIQDIAQIAAGNLNGHFPMQTQLANLLQQHGLTSADFQNILAQDPYGSCAADISCVQRIGTPAARFYPTTQEIPFQNYGISGTQQFAYQQTNQTGQGGSSAFSLGFTLSGSASFQNVWSASLTNQNVLTWTNKWSYATTTMTGQQATAHITEPPPSVPYSGPIQFGIFQDNVYGTFIFYPTE